MTLNLGTYIKVMVRLMKENTLEWDLHSKHDLIYLIHVLELGYVAAWLRWRDRWRPMQRFYRSIFNETVHKERTMKTVCHANFAQLRTWCRVTWHTYITGPEVRSCAKFAWHIVFFVLSLCTVSLIMLL